MPIYWWILAMFLKPNALSPAERSDLRKIRRLLEAGARTLSGDAGNEVQLPDLACTMMKQIMSELDSGNGISMVPVGPELAVRQAATLLGVLRPAFTGLLEAGHLPYLKTGSHLRIHLRNLRDYQRRRDVERKAALAPIAKEAFALGMHDRTRIPEGGEVE